MTLYSFVALAKGVTANNALNPLPPEILLNEDLELASLIHALTKNPRLIPSAAHAFLSPFFIAASTLKNLEALGRISTAVAAAKELLPTTYELPEPRTLGDRFWRFIGLDEAMAKAFSLTFPGNADEWEYSI